MNRCIREPYVQWCERLSPSALAGGAVYSISNCFYSSPFLFKSIVNYKDIVHFNNLYYKLSLNYLKLDYFLNLLPFSNQQLLNLIFLFYGKLIHDKNTHLHIEY